MMDHDTVDATGFAAERPGLQALREVLGEAYAERAMAEADPMVTAFRDAALTICWDTAWSRPGLERNLRSAITLAMLVALNRPTEVELHVQGALRNGLSEQDITEILIHAAAYCGVPAALDGLRAARKGLATSRNRETR
jgi:4-carboxymuconolactone decarboxylase